MCTNIHLTFSKGSMNSRTYILNYKTLQILDFHLYLILDYKINLQKSNFIGSEIHRTHHIILLD